MVPSPQIPGVITVCLEKAWVPKGGLTRRNHQLTKINKPVRVPEKH